MKLQILSDLHIEFAPYEIVDTDADVVMLAGDIHLGDKGFKWAYDNIKEKEVIYNNHQQWLQQVVENNKKQYVVVDFSTFKSTLFYFIYNLF